MYDYEINSWSEVGCVGSIPARREGHAAAMIGDVMYIFGGRASTGILIGDLAAFKITTQRWFNFQDIGSSPSPRWGHSMITHG